MTNSFAFYKQSSMNYWFKILGAAFGLVLMVSCDSSTNKTEGSAEQQNEGQLSAEEPLLETPTFKKFQPEMNPDAILDIYNPFGNEDFEIGKVAFSFNIRNHGLGRNNPLMLSLNGGTSKPYTQPNFQLDLNKGTYRAVAYLLNGEGFALKEYGNYSVRDFTVGGSKPFPSEDAPYLILHLPNEAQVYSSNESVVVDFLYLGGGPESDGVKVHIEVDDAVFTLKEIASVKIGNLSKGAHRLRVSLRDANTGKELNGIFSSYTRNIEIQ